MDVFKLRDQVVSDYGRYVRSFIRVADPRIEELVERRLQAGLFWPEPLLQLNPAFEPGAPLPELISKGLLEGGCREIFCSRTPGGAAGEPYRLHQHQVEAIEAYSQGDNYVLTTGTGSGKSLAYIVPIVNHVLRHGSGKGIQAIVVYPMNALANSQLLELQKFLDPAGTGKPPVTFARYTGQEKPDERDRIRKNPPDILLTNYVMLELVLSRVNERALVEGARDLRFLVLDELHTYRGRQGADVAMLCRRVREACRAEGVLHVGTSATLAGGATWAQQQAEVADVATELFGAEVKPERVIGETLRRVTEPFEPRDEDHAREILSERVAQRKKHAPTDESELCADPLAGWLESTAGLDVEEGSGRLVRRTPQPLRGESGLVARLAAASGEEADACEDALSRLLLAGYDCRNAAGRSVLAFRLHQFLSRGESVLASLEAADERHLTLKAQEFVPGSNREKRLFRLAFCRECGQEYYLARRISHDGENVYETRELSERIEEDEEVELGYLHAEGPTPWPQDDGARNERVPETWLEVKDAKTIVKQSQRHRLPVPVRVAPDGRETEDGLPAHWISAPFVLCLECGVAYDPHQRSDFAKLATLGAEGRSSATTITALSTIRGLKRSRDLEPEARKLLSFTDNRQDASLQAGHFNDFVEIGLLRAALYRAARDAGTAGLAHDELTLKVAAALNLDLRTYAADPDVKYLQLDETQKALRDVLGYGLYRDLRRGWRVTSPNLEQAGLLRIDYRALSELCRDEEVWGTRHEALASARPEERDAVARVLLDFLRRELAIKVDYLEPEWQDAMKQRSSQHLRAPWSLDDLEKLERAQIVFPGSRPKGRVPPFHSFLSARGGFGLFLKRAQTFPQHAGVLKTDDAEQLIRDLLEGLRVAGLVRKVVEDDGGPPGYQLAASALVWHAGDGEQAYHDPIRVPRVPEGGLQTNPFFVDFYSSELDDMQDVQSREHTAQVRPEDRERREAEFRAGELRALFCSPTMELGVDIAELNVVGMRNVPPTPANYAQRSGRAGRSGQPALVTTYCSSGSPHDQWFFKRPEKMVAGSVATPRLDLANEELLRAHVHAVWLGHACLKLGSSLEEVLDLSNVKELALRGEVHDRLSDQKLQSQARERVLRALGKPIEAWLGSREKAAAWIEEVLRALPQTFDRACDRWRNLFRSATAQRDKQHERIDDMSLPQAEREAARRLRGQAERQRDLLKAGGNEPYSDFNSYRYFASEGWLPGYSFPRLPLAAYIPGRKNRRGDDDHVQRPRFLAISEFGPRSIIYHEGAKYQVTQVTLPVGTGEDELLIKAKTCEHCGYLHDEQAETVDLCRRCDSENLQVWPNLLRMADVRTTRRERINSDEEERRRLGYDVRTHVRFGRRDGTVADTRTAQLVDAGGDEIAELQYGAAATLWRVNVGERRRAAGQPPGFEMDLEKGSWAKRKDEQAVKDDDEPGARRARVVPFVEDHRNCLLLEPSDASGATESVLAGLQAALKAAIQVEFELEDSELAAEPLPAAKDRRLILLYESAEGGAGVLRRLVEDAQALPQVAKRALEICHFDPETGEDLSRGDQGDDWCEAGCYDCLLHYGNQPEHRLIDRHLLVDMLREWATGTVECAPAARPRSEHLEELLKHCESDLERKWLRVLHDLGLRLPDDAQVYVAEAQCRPDYVYSDSSVAIFVDGPAHAEELTAERDRQSEARLLGLGWTPLRFRHDEDWRAIFAQYAELFGPLPPETPEAATPEPEALAFDEDLFEPEWVELARGLSAQDGLSVEPGGEVLEGERVAGSYVLVLQGPASRLHLVDAAAQDAETAARILRGRGERTVLLEAGEATVDRLLDHLHSGGE